MLEYPNENTMLVKQAYQKATGASIHKAKRLIGSYRTCLLMVSEAKTKQELESYTAKRDKAEKALAGFVKKG